MIKHRAILLECDCGKECMIPGRHLLFSACFTLTDDGSR